MQLAHGGGGNQLCTGDLTGKQRDPPAVGGSWKGWDMPWTTALQHDVCKAGVPLGSASPIEASFCLVWWSHQDNDVSQAPNPSLFPSPPKQVLHLSLSVCICSQDLDPQKNWAPGH